MGSCWASLQCMQVLNVLQVQESVPKQVQASKSMFGSKWVSSINLGGPIDKTQFTFPITEREVFTLMRSSRNVRDSMTDVGTEMFLK